MRYWSLPESSGARSRTKRASPSTAPSAWKTWLCKLSAARSGAAGAINSSIRTSRASSCGGGRDHWLDEHVARFQPREVGGHHEARAFADPDAAARRLDRADL